MRATQEGTIAPMIDLHSHTTASDGELSPEALVQLAVRQGVTTLAVTDHDTVASIARATAAGSEIGLRVVPGIEVSATLNRREVHVLGHFVDPNDGELSKYDARLKAERRDRMEQMVAKLQKLGFPVTMAMVEAIAQDAHLARPHLARVLMTLNYCTSTQEAFDKFLGDGRPAAVPKFELPFGEAIAMIRRAKGVATIAHPGVSKIERHEIDALAKAGLQGIESEHTDHAPTTRAKFRGWAQELGLVCTAGSDFHGPNVAPGRHLGTASMAPEAFAVLEGHARA